MQLTTRGHRVPILTAVGALLVLAVILGRYGTATGATGSTAASPGGYYVSIGDSYAAGYQPAHDGSPAGTTTAGFVYQVAQGLPGVTLHNVACSGFTTQEVLTSLGCARSALGPGATPYPGRTQLAAATDFLRTHSGHIRAVTIEIGGNDVLACGDPQKPAWQSCITGALAALRTNLTTIVAEVRDAAGSAPVIGLTYPDTFLNRYLSTSAAERKIAVQSVGFFHDTFNPELKAVYTGAGARFLDVTAATDAYAAFTPLVTDGVYGLVPPPVAEVCDLTFSCSQGDVHPTDAGYTVIAQVVLAVLGAS